MTNGRANTGSLPPPAVTVIISTGHYHRLTFRAGGGAVLIQEGLIYFTDVFMNDNWAGGKLAPKVSGVTTRALASFSLLKSFRHDYLRSQTLPFGRVWQRLAVQCTHRRWEPGLRLPTPLSTETLPEVCARSCVDIVPLLPTRHPTLFPLVSLLACL